ncbi:aldehyde dehydrogenase family protein [Paracoccus sp. pheM1]|nr:aldehyde dehydrogenase family protein [Paracoccus sp. pheM1]
MMLHPMQKMELPEKPERGQFISLLKSAQNARNSSGSTGAFLARSGLRPPARRGGCSTAASIWRFEAEDEAVANARKCRLAGYFYARHPSHVWRVVGMLEIGMVRVNASLISSEVMPFGGVKQSCLGREGSTMASRIA